MATSAAFDTPSCLCQVTGRDIVQSQIKIAEGRSLSEIGLTQDSIKLQGYAIQCRITTEDPLNNFAPDTGRRVKQKRTAKLAALSNVQLLQKTTLTLQAVSTSGVLPTALAFVSMAAHFTPVLVCFLITTRC